VVVLVSGCVYEAQPVVVVHGPHVGVLKGAKKEWRESEGIAERLKGRGMGRREADGVIAVLRPTQDGFVVHWCGIPLIPPTLHIISHGE